MNKKILKRKFKFVAEPVVSYVKKDNIRRSMNYTKYYNSLKVEEDTIFYESRDGKSISDSPFAIFQALLTNDKYKHFKHIWSVSNPNELSQVIEEYSNYPNVQFVKRNSKEYLKYLASSKYLINNSTFQPFFTPKDEQVYINTWHGTPLKKMGYDIPGNPSGARNVVRNFLSSDYLLSPNAHTTDMYLKSFKLDGLYSGKIIEDGYPRIDLTFHTDKAQYIAKLKNYGLKISEEKKIVVYAPTWKGTGNTVRNDIRQVVTDMRYLRKKIGKEYNVFVKVHPFVYRYAKNDKSLAGLLIPDFVDTNQLLSVVDILITDYSSIFFDFLVTDRPILFYMWDKETYLTERETYFSNDELPGAVLTKVSEVAETILNIDTENEKYRGNYERYKQLFTNYDDGQVTKRFIEYLFEGKKNDLKVVENLDQKKEKIIIYPGGLLNNGITSSVINLLDNIDYDKYDVSCFINPSNNVVVLNNLDKINKNVRFLFRFDTPLYKMNEIYRDRIVKNRSMLRKREAMLYPEKAYQLEMRRLLGKSSFDYAIDYSGYSYFWAKYLINANVKRKICFMHSDMLADSERTVGGRRPHYQNLRGLFSIYNKFDKLISVSESTMEVNKKNLAKYADLNKFEFVNNSLNYKKILDGSKEELIEEKVMEIPSEENINFVTMGRLSPEKGQDNLIRAFAEFHKTYSNSRLYIIGDGPLRFELEDLAMDLDVEEVVHFTGQMDNPFALLNKCDCFVLSSHYEGQPMVLLESLVLKKDIIATNIVANRHVLEDGKYGILVDDSVEGLIEGFNKYLGNGKKSHDAVFDYETYNKNVMKKFYSTLK